MTDADLAERVIGILAAVADGAVADAEAAWWLKVRRTHPLFAGLAHDDVEDMLRRTRAALSGLAPLEAVARWAGAVPAEAAEAVYALALDLQLADGRSAREEKAATVALARALGLSPERAAEVFAQVLHARGVDF